MHKGLAVKLTRAGLLDKVRESEGGAIQAYRARFTKLERAAQSLDARMEASKQKTSRKDKEKTL